MNTRLNVTEAERLCYSRRKLQAISALRHAGIDPSVFGLHKDYRVPGVRGKVYLVQQRDGMIAQFQRLSEIIIYAREILAWKNTPLTWAEIRKAPAKQLPQEVACQWPGCSFCAKDMMDRQLFCGAHAFIYQQMRAAHEKRALSSSLPPLPTPASSAPARRSP
jgi:hypothetical protein